MLSVAGGRKQSVAELRLSALDCNRLPTKPHRPPVATGSRKQSISASRDVREEAAVGDDFALAGGKFRHDAESPACAGAVHQTAIPRTAIKHVVFIVFL